MKRKQYKRLHQLIQESIGEYTRFFKEKDLESLIIEENGGDNNASKRDAFKRAEGSGESSVLCAAEFGGGVDWIGQSERDVDEGRKSKDGV